MTKIESINDAVVDFIRTCGPMRADQILRQFHEDLEGVDLQDMLDDLVREERLNYFKSLGTYAIWSSKPVHRLSDVNLEPMPGKVIVRVDQSDQQVGGIWLIRNAKQSIGQIVAIYQDFDDPDTDAHVAPFLHLEDWVLFGMHSGVDVTFNREKYVILRESEILCRVIDPEAVEDRRGVQAV